ncbi:PAAR domain-containing protein [Photobacterium damselae]|uniref:PAAR domain-containing protein n=1 Tax=Photobacterium damselae TaxID=38293 RepID=UPI00370C0D24
MKPKGLIYKGCKTTTGGVVLEGVGDVWLYGSGVSYEGALASCPACKVGKGYIVSDHKLNVIVDYKRGALEGDIVACGCPYGSNRLIPNPGTFVFVADENGLVRATKYFTNDTDKTETIDEINRALNADNPVSTTIVQTSVEMSQSDKSWEPVYSNYPILVYRTKRKLNDWDADDMKFKDESKEQIIKYGIWNVFNDKFSPSYQTYPMIESRGKIIDQFNFSIEKHIHYMKQLGSIFSFYGETKDVYFKLLDRFKSNIGGVFTDESLTRSMKEHESTNEFTTQLVDYIGSYLNGSNVISNVDDLLSFITLNMNNNARLPKYNKNSIDLINGTVVSVHDIWGMEVYLTKLEKMDYTYRGEFEFIVQDHFGLNSPDIDHDEFGESSYEFIQGFRSWYILQHYYGYGLKPIITEMKFTKTFEFYRR